MANKELTKPKLFLGNRPIMLEKSNAESKESSQMMILPFATAMTIREVTFLVDEISFAVSELM
jgi:hypothetical protein